MSLLSRLAALQAVPIVSKSAMSDHVLPASAVFISIALQAREPSKEDVRHHLQGLRAQVLQGVHLVFSHVIPLEQDMTQHPLWQLATQVHNAGSYDLHACLYVHMACPASVSKSLLQLVNHVCKGLVRAADWSSVGACKEITCCLCLQLGAMCHASVADSVTHVVSTAQDTDKMHWAKRHNRHRVSINWLYESGRYCSILLDVPRCKGTHQFFLMQ